MNRQIPSEDRYTDAPPGIAEEIKASVAIGDDFPSPDELRRELKRSVTIRLDPDVYAWFQLPGPGYQTRINAVLRHYMEQWKADKATVHPVFPETTVVSEERSKVAEKSASKKDKTYKSADKGATHKLKKKGKGFLARAKARRLKGQKGRTASA
ncbi:MAG: BrnA antitoxin family protein [Spirochaetia bacterium]